MSVTLSLASGTSSPGGIITLALSIASTGGDLPTQVQWVFSHTADVSLASVAIGAAGVAASKTLSQGGNLMLVWGVNQTAIADGILANVTFRVSAFPTGNSTTISITSIVVSDADANTLTSVGSSGTIDIIPTPPTPGLPCTGITPQPTDVQFRIEKVMVCIRPDAHLPVRGTTR